MRFEIDPTPEETRRACIALAQAGLPPSRATLILIGLYAVVGLAAYLLTPATGATTFAIGVLAVLATAMALQAEARRRVRRLGANDPHAREPHFIELSSEGVHTWCAHVDARYPWPEFRAVKEVKEFYLFVRLSGSGSALPKRVLEQGQQVELRARIREWSPDHGAQLTREAHAS
jgi:hypothetical protein